MGLSSVAQGTGKLDVWTFLSGSAVQIQPGSLDSKKVIISQLIHTLSERSVALLQDLKTGVCILALSYRTVIGPLVSHLDRKARD